MPAPVVLVRHAVVKLKAIYACVGCGKTEYGSSLATVEIDTPELMRTRDLSLANTHVDNSHMPHGWAGYGLDRHKCENCKT